MRKPLTDSLCAELAKDFKPFKVRVNPLKSKNGFKTSTTYRVTELRKNALNLWVIRFVKSKTDWLAQNFDMIVETKAEPKRIIKGLTPIGREVEGVYSHTDEDGFDWIYIGLEKVKLIATETIDSLKLRAQEIDSKLKELDDTFELEFKYFDKPKPNPDNQTVNALVQYVSEHKESMSKESILHFANLIGLIKLGAL
jgi:hypothetical protein